MADLSRAAAELRITEAEAALKEVTATDPEAKRDMALERLLSARAMLNAAQAASIGPQRACIRGRGGDAPAFCMSAA